jgi:hypothetical protein
LAFLQTPAERASGPSAWPASVLDAAHCWATMFYWRRHDQLAAGGAVLHGAQQLHVQVRLLETELVGEVIATEVQEEAGQRRDGPRKCRSRGDGGGPDRSCRCGEAGVTKEKVVGLGVGKLNSIAKWVPAPPVSPGRPASIRFARWRWMVISTSLSEKRVVSTSMQFCTGGSSSGRAWGRRSRRHDWCCSA